MTDTPTFTDRQIERHLGELDVSGFTVIEDVIDPTDVAAVRESVAATVESVSGYSDKGVGFLATVLNHDQSVIPYLTDERLTTLISRALGPFAHVSFASAIINAPGNPRGTWHSDWPFNQHVAGHVPAPYPDAVMHITTLWMLSPFTAETGGTLVVPGSHRSPTNPTADTRFSADESLPGEVNATGQAGDVLMFDSRLWHSTATNVTAEPRVALAIRFAPWWLDVSILRPGSRKRAQMVDEPGVLENEAPSLAHAVYGEMGEDVRPLFRHMVE